jgi:hypothetical protein
MANGKRNTTKEYAKHTNKQLIHIVRSMIRTDNGGSSPIIAAQNGLVKRKIPTTQFAKAAYLAGREDQRDGDKQRIQGATTELIRRLEKR